MRKIIRDRRGDISAPVITILLVIASISIAALVISWLFGVGISTSKQATLQVIGTPTLYKTSSTAYNLTLVVKVVGSANVTISSVMINTGTTVIQATNIVIKDITTSSQQIVTTLAPGRTYSITANISIATISANNISGLIISSAGNVPFNAIVQS